MQQRNRQLEAGLARDPLADALERQMAEFGTAIAAARLEAAAALAPHLAQVAGFPQAELQLVGALEDALAQRAAITVEDAYMSSLGRARPRDAAARRTLEGPHRSDVVVHHLQAGRPARLGSTGEQKALLTGLTLAQLAAVRGHSGRSPIVLLDEVVAHLDDARREALLGHIAASGAQVWMTGTDMAAFAVLSGLTQCLEVAEAVIMPR